jgi:hypothetical protein
MLNESMRSVSSQSAAPLSAAQLAAEESRRTKRVIGPCPSFPPCLSPSLSHARSVSLSVAEKKRRERQFRQDMHKRLQQKVTVAVETPERKEVLAERRRNEMLSDRRKVQERVRRERLETEQKRRAAEVQYRVEAPVRTTEVQHLHELATEQRERQMQEAQLLQAELMQRAEADAKPGLEKLAAKRYNKAVRAALTDKIAALPQELPPLSPSGSTQTPSTSNDIPLCWGVNGWTEPAANCPFRTDAATHDALLRQMVAQWATQ